jgi:MOZ/SAS family/MYST family zinc finger domain
MPSVESPRAVMEAPGSTPHRRASLKILSRNIDTVILGNMLFGTWYYSPYPDSVILRSGLPPGKTANGSLANGTGPLKAGIACPRLHVCPLCFAYSPREDEYIEHLLRHQEQQKANQWSEPVPKSAFKVYEWEGYAVWEVDGEREKLYCQNLSLFGKLFLEQKSVFFDTGGFKYYVLTYTPTETQASAKPRGRKRASSTLDDSLFKTKVLGFFSKENLSWDSNNLACILIFPPFQHRQLGQLLMAVSYKLSGWEWEGGVIGGPEKPLSTMGRKSYLRFWSDRIARFVMGQTADADQRKVFDDTKKRKNGLAKEEMTVKEIGDRTGMLAEDVIAALNEMGICEVKPPKRKKKNSSELNGGGAPPEQDDDPLATMTISRAKVLAWAQMNSVEIVSAVKEEGFLGEWALSDTEDAPEDGEEERDVDSEE